MKWGTLYLRLLSAIAECVEANAPKESISILSDLYTRYKTEERTEAFFDEVMEKTYAVMEKVMQC